MNTQWHGHTVKSFSAVNGLQLRCIDMDETQTLLGPKKGSRRRIMKYSVSLYQVQVRTKLNGIFLMICTWMVKA